MLFSREKNSVLYFASDIHGSQKCFNKFINSGKFYGADTIVMGGDITGKSILHIEKRDGGIYRSNFMGKENTFHSMDEVADFEKTVKTGGFYPFISTKEEWEHYKNDAPAMDKLFFSLMKASLEEWMDFAERKLAGTGIRCFVMPGNDDPLAVTDILKESSCMVNPDGRVVEVDEHRTMVGCGFSNPTPWDSPRECSEEELLAKIESVMKDVKDPANCILCAHVPPYNSTLDDAPKLSSDMQVQSSGGQVQFSPVGSTAVSEAILKYGYVLGLHGHIHEAHAVKMVGKTLCINPGSDYGDGTLHGALVTFSKEKIRNYQLVSG